MIWLTWRQFRIQAVVVSAVAGRASAILLLVTGPHLVTLYRHSALGDLPQATAARTPATFLNALVQDAHLPAGLHARGRC